MHLNQPSCELFSVYFCMFYIYFILFCPVCINYVFSMIAFLSFIALLVIPLLILRSFVIYIFNITIYLQKYDTVDIDDCKNTIMLCSHCPHCSICAIVVMYYTHILYGTHNVLSQFLALDNYLLK